MTKAIMIQGAGSNVGKSMLVAGIARACLRRRVCMAAEAHSLKGKTLDRAVCTSRRSAGA